MRRYTWDDVEFAYGHGRVAFRHGQGLPDCPFESGTLVWKDWRVGWRDARDFWGITQPAELHKPGGPLRAVSDRVWARLGDAA